jgi:DNA-binding transcriptional ArsR family regulator
MRVRLLDELDRRGEANVQTRADELSATQQNASRPLGVLTQAGLLARRQDGRVVWYRLAEEDVFSLAGRTAADVTSALRGLQAGD